MLMVDFVRLQNKPAMLQNELVAKLKGIQEAWTNILLFQSGQDTKNTRPREEEREFRFQTTVHAMVKEFMDHVLAIVTSGGIVGDEPPFDWVDMYGMISPKAARFYNETTQKFKTYVRFIVELASFEQMDTSAFYMAASAVLITGSNLGAWLDLVL